MGDVVPGAAWLRSASHGYCGETNDFERGDCEIGDQGNLGLWKVGPSAANWKTAGWPAAASACLALCSRCTRCRFVSLSLQFQDCSWYNKCPRLKHKVNGFRSALARPNSSTARTPRVPGRLARAGPKDRTLRRRLRQVPTTGSLKWPWFAPHEHARLRVAVLLFGKIGTLVDPSSWVAPDRGDERVVRLARASFETHVLHANPTAQIQVFAHSWNPALKPTIERVWRPIWSRSEPEVRNIDKVKSFSLSLHSVLAAKRAHERSSGFSFHLVLAMRHDILFYRSLDFSALPEAQASRRARSVHRQ